MAISKNTKNKYKSSTADYKESSGVTNARNNLSKMANQAPVYTNSYATQLNDIYSKLKQGKDFNYNPQNDAAFRRFADEYNALSELAIAENQAQAEGLTGGYGSTYAPEVATQGLARMKDNVQNAEPLFMEQAQNAYMANNDALKNMYQAAADARNDELEAYGNRANAYDNQYSMAQKRYSDTRDFDYNKYNDNREFWSTQYKNEQDQANTDAEYQFKIYDTYNKLAAQKCADYADKKNNSGMKAYLNGLVKEGKLTKYMADNLYKQYKYTAPSRSGGSGGRSRSSGRSSLKSSGGYDPMEEWSPNERIIKFINMNNRADDYSTALGWIDYLIKEGRLDKDEKLYYAYYYKDMLKH